MIDRRDLDQYRTVAEGVIQFDTELAGRLIKENPLMKLAIEGVTDIRINYAKGVRDALDLVLSGEPPVRLTSMLADYNNRVVSLGSREVAMGD